MNSIVKLKSGSLYEDKYSYSRAVVVDRWIFMSLTAGRNYKTREMPGTAVEQAKCALDNVEGALKSIGSSLGDIVRSRVIIPNQAEVASVLDLLGSRFAGIDPAISVCCSPLAGPEYLFEIEVTAYKDSSLLPKEQVVVVL